MYVVVGVDFLRGCKLNPFLSTTKYMRTNKSQWITANIS